MQFQYSDNNKRYHTLDYYYKQKFGQKIMKVSLNAGFSCPHLKSGGCIYCSNSGSGEYAGKIEDSLTEQFNKGKNMMNLMREVLGKTRKVEERMENRTYRYKVYEPGGNNEWHR